MSKTKKFVRPTWKQVRELESVCETLQKANTLMETELKNIRRELEKEQYVSSGRLCEIDRLKKRNIFERILNL